MTKKQELFLEHKRNWYEFTKYQPHNGQEKLHFPDKEARFTVSVCGRRWGKSIGASKEIEPLLLQPNKRVWVVAPTYSGAEKVFREVWRELIMKQGQPTRRASYKDMYIEFEWGSVFEGKSADNPNSLVGEGLDYLVLDECAKMKKVIWEMYLRPTLSDRKGKALFITTPEGYNWIYDLYLLGQDKNEKNWNSFNSPSWENQYAYPDGQSDEDIQEVRKNIDKTVFDQEYGAKFTSMAGRVYPFDRNLDCGNYPYNHSLPTYCAIDFGYRMPSAGWFQVDIRNGKPHIYIIDEICHKKNVKTDEFAKMTKQRPYKIVAYFGDPAGKNVQAQSGLGDIDIFRRFGISVRSVRDKTSRSINAGISHVRSFIENADKERYLHIDYKCKGLSEDLENYRYPPEKEGMNLKLDPIKDGYHDHGCDMIRYFFINRFPIRQQGINIVRNK